MHFESLETESAFYSQRKASMMGLYVKHATHPHSQGRNRPTPHRSRTSSPAQASCTQSRVRSQCKLIRGETNHYQSAVATDRKGQTDGYQTTPAAAEINGAWPSRSGAGVSASRTRGPASKSRRGSGTHS